MTGEHMKIGRTGGRFRFLGILAVCLLLAAAAPAFAQSETPANNSPIAASGAAPPDAEIDRRIEGIFDEIEGMSGIFVTVHSGVVTLRGRVTETSVSERAAQLASRVEGVVEVNNRIETVTEVTTRIMPVWERLKNRTVEIIQLAPLLAVSLAVFAVISAIGWWIAAREFPWSRIAPNAFIASLLRQIVRLCFLGAGLLVALDILGSTALLGTILGAAGIVGLAIGFAVRDTVENYIASILLSIRQPFRPMDYVDIDGTEGSVLGLTARATILMDSDGNHIRIPNASVFKAKIINYDRNPERRFTFIVPIAPSGSTDHALATGLAAIAGLDFVLKDPAPDCWITDTDENAVKLWFGAWINQRQTSYLKARSEAIRRVTIALGDAGFEAPRPGLRILMESEAKPARKSQAKRQEDRQDAIDTAPDELAVSSLKQERAKLASNDLLDEAAPQEID